MCCIFFVVVVYHFLLVVLFGPVTEFYNCAKSVIVASNLSHNKLRIVLCQHNTDETMLEKNHIGTLRNH